MPVRTARVASMGLLCILACACEGARTKRDIHAPAHEMTYDDSCGLQDYFDERRASSLPPPRAADETVRTNEDGKTAGEGSYQLADPMSRRRFAKMLREEYSGIDSKVVRSVENGDGDVLVHVRWWDAGQIRRLHPESKVIVRTSAGETVLPPNMCVSDLLFGEELYAKRAAYLRNEVESATGK